ncbi:MAG: hypothetical protein WBP56_07985 [Polyangia bacterium]
MTIACLQVHGHRALFLSVAVMLAACAKSSPTNPGGQGGDTPSSNSGGSSGGIVASRTSTGGFSASAGGSTDTGSSSSTGGSSQGGSFSASGGSMGSGGTPATGGAAGETGGSSTGGSSTAGRGGSGGPSSSGGSSGTSGSSRADAGVDAPLDSGPPPIAYALDPPNQLINQFFIPGCQSGVATSPGGGVCTPGQNACEGTKQGARINFLCPRFMLFSDEMVQAAADDGTPGLNYAVVGHDVDTGGIDGTVTISCCQCYQLVFSLPENVAQVGGNGASAIPIPPPLVVQAFNTSAGGGKNFDVFMGAGGFGAFNACDPNASPASPSGKYFYTEFPPDGEPGSGGENAATQIAGCKANGLVTTASLSSTTCQSAVATQCGKFNSASPTVTSESIHSCTQSNAANSYYHMNWQIYAKRVECPTHLMQVTGCELASQGLPAVNPAVTTPAQAAADSSFKSGYTTTTMQDCCMPTCAWQNNVGGQNVPVVGLYDSFYSCDQNGVPATQSSTADAGN